MGTLLFIFLMGITSCRSPESEASKAGKDNSESLKIVSLNGTYTEGLVVLGMQENIVGVDAISTYPPELDDTRIDKGVFKAEWLALKDKHDFYGLLRKHKVTRTQALRLAPAGGYAVEVANSALRETMTAAARTELPTMVFVGNRGIIQIHTGPVTKLINHNEWFNAIYPDFNLNAKDPEVTQSWIVRKPTEDGMVTSLELFNAKNKLIVTLFDKRNPELEGWRNIIADLENTHVL
jgi:putative hemin transport protein